MGSSGVLQVAPDALQRKFLLIRNVNQSLVVLILVFDAQRLSATSFYLQYFILRLSSKRFL